MRSEACLVAGDDREAETLCYKTLYDARGAGQIGNCLGAELLLARIGLLRGDEKMYSAARGNIKRDMAQARQTALTRLGEMGLAHLNMALGKTGELPEWLRHTEAIRKTLYIFAQPYAMMLHSMMLLLEESRAELYALSEPALKTAAEMHYPLLLTMHLIFLARARQDERKIEKAADHLREALAIALPDRVYLPFAEHGDALQPLLRRLQGEFDQERMEECLALCRRWSVGARALRRTLPGEFSSAALTPRQREIALLIRDGLAVKEIAAQLSLSESTVAWVRKEIYSKLNIHSNVELTKVKL
jgi:LuxR family maltose regulon positive regulatory protein